MLNQGRGGEEWVNIVSLQESKDVKHIEMTHQSCIIIVTLETFMQTVSECSYILADD